LGSHSPIGSGADAIVQQPLGDSRLETLLQAVAAIVVAVASLMIAVSAWLDS
jgi:hypothetical protein